MADKLISVLENGTFKRFADRGDGTYPDFQRRASPMNTTWIPDRKIWASGLAYVVAAVIVKAIETYTGFDVPPFLEEWAPVGLAGAVAYFVPPSVQDVLRRLNDQIVAAAARDPKIPVTPAIAPIVDAAMTDALITAGKL